jgi:hypothetical protein
LFLTTVTGHNKRVVPVLHALVPVVFRFEHVEGYGNVSAPDLTVLVKTQCPQHEHMNIVHSIFLLLAWHPRYASLLRSHETKIGEKVQKGRTLTNRSPLRWSFQTTKKSTSSANIEKKRAKNIQPTDLGSVCK